MRAFLGTLLLALIVVGCDSAGSDEIDDSLSGSYEFRVDTWRWFLGNRTFNEEITGTLSIVQSGEHVSGVGTCEIHQWLTAREVVDFDVNATMDVVVSGSVVGDSITIDIGRGEPDVPWLPLVGCPRGTYRGATTDRLSLSGDLVVGALINRARLQTGSADSTKVEVVHLTRVSP